MKMKRIHSYYSTILLSVFFLFFFINNIHSQQSWIKTNGIDSFPVYEFVSLNKTLFAATFGAGIYKTDDEGKTWERCNEGLKDLMVRSLIKKGKTLFAGTRGAGVFKSENEGKSWTLANDTINSRATWSLFSHGDILLAGTDREPKTGSGSGRGGGIYVSYNEGENWIKSKLPNTDAHHQIIFCFGAKGNKILAGSSKYLYQSEDKGRSWKAISVPTYLSITSIALHGNQMLIGTSGEGVFTSRNGEKWESYDGNKGNIRSLLNADNALVMGVSIDGVKQDDKFINEGFFKPAIRSLIFHKGKLYAGTFKEGVWRYDKSKGNFTPPPNTSRTALRDVNIYPNPVDNGLLTIEYELTETTTNTSIQLYDSFGKRLANISPLAEQYKGRYQVQYDLSNLTDGTYYVHLQLGDRSISKSIIMIQ